MKRTIISTTLLAMALNAHAGLLGMLIHAPTSKEDAKQKVEAACAKYLADAATAAAAGIPNPRPLRTKACASAAKHNLIPATPGGQPAQPAQPGNKEIAK